MSNLIVIRIVPQSPVDPNTFTTYLSALGELQITAFDLSFNSPTSGQNVGTAAYLAPNAGTPDPTSAVLNPPPGFTLTPPAYPAGTTNGIVQQYDEMPAKFVGLSVESAFFQIEAVATAVIEVTPAGFENLKLVAQWGSGAGATAIPITTEYYDVTLAPATADPNQWATLAPSLYLQIPAPPAAAGGTSLTLAQDGTPPPFDDLLTAVKATLAKDPGGALPDLSKLTPEQSRNIAYEIVWSQQKPLPVPQDPLENLYTNPPNNGQFLSGSTPNQNEGDRQQFEAQLTGYYSLADATADRLTNFVFSLGAAVACEQLSIAATQAMLQFPVDPGSPGDAAINDAEIILTGLAGATSFGIPAAYFYALAASVPSQITAAQRYTRATGDSMAHLLSDLTTAINEGVVKDPESFVTSAMAGINAAQAARRLSALSISAASTTPDLAISATVQPIVVQWLAFASTEPSPSSQNYQPGDDDKLFWPGAATANPSAFLALVLCVVTDGYFIPAPTSASLAFEITQLLLTPLSAGTPTVDTLRAVTDAQWASFFNTNPTWLPPFTKPGNTAAQITAFVHYVQKYIDVPSSGAPSTVIYLTSAPTAASPVLTFISTAGIVATMSVSGTGITAGTTVLGPVTATSVTLSRSVNVAANVNITFTPNYVNGVAGNLPLLDSPQTDWLQQGLTAYGPFTFGSGFNTAQLQTAVETVFPDDIRAQKWLFDALSAIDNIYQILKSVPLASTNPQAYEFSLAEALYARGFTSAAEVTALSASDFQTALTGTIAYDFAAPIYASSALISPPSPAQSSGGAEFVPVNPDGSLTNCIPPACQSPLGPVAYLGELLKVSTGSTCDAPWSENVVLNTAAETQSGNVLSFANLPGVVPGMTVTAANLPANTVVSTMTANSVTLSQSVTAPVPSGTAVTFTPVTIASVIAARRGPVANLAATCANLETTLPLIDVVNECLEFMGSAIAPAGGTVYDTSSDFLAGYALCSGSKCEKDGDCSEPDTIFAAMPEYSTPATPVAANSAVDPQVYNNLKTDFSSCCLPYSQALDVSRTYLKHFRTCRYEEMRTFRKCITEFVLDPVNQPAGFQSHLWRYPVRIDTAIEYLGITPEEYALLFQGAQPPPCGNPDERPRDASGGATPVWQLYGFPSAGDRVPWTEVVTTLSEFLKRTCLSYCEFVELSKCSPVPFEGRSQRDRDANGFPDCEPCCLENITLVFPENPGIEQSLFQLAVFIRLWRKLKDLCGAGYSFCRLRDICDVLHLFNGNTINPDFIRQLASFQMLRNCFHLPLVDPDDPPAAGAIDADRTHLLALWVGPSAAKWNWAVHQLIDRVGHYAKQHHHCERRSPEFVKLLAANLDPLSSFAGFGSAAADTWHALPTHTLRFAEILAKIYASDFSIGEILYLFSAGAHMDAEDPFPLQDGNEANDLPLNLPEDEQRYSLTALRRKILEVCVADEEVHHWTWKRIEATLQDDFGYAASDVRSFAAHFFPGVLEHAGYSVDAAAVRYVSALPLASTVPQMWNTPPDGPFHYDSGAQDLSTRVPLRDLDVIGKLTQVRPLQGPEQQAVQDLYFQPRVSLALFAMLFGDFAAAERHLIEEREEKERWNYFRKQFALSHRRCSVIAEHLSSHVAATTGMECPEGSLEARLLLRGLFADENKALADWENDAGTVPPVTWTPPPSGGAFAALLGLAGTGLIAEYTPHGGPLAWRDAAGSLALFDRERDKENCPVPTVLPAMDLTLTPQQLRFISALNGFAMKDATGAWLGGAQGFDVKWTGALVIDGEGSYEFSAGNPEGGNVCDRRWRVTLKRGQRTWILLAHHWPEAEDRHSTHLPLRQGAYELTVELTQPAPSFRDDMEVRELPTGLHIHYCGPDSQDRPVEIPHSSLFCISKDGPLGNGVKPIASGASTFLQTLYVSSLRDIRRTYQRAFKALLFVHRFGLSAKPSGRQSELGYMLHQKDNFAGASYYRSGPSFAQHKAGLDFNFLPLLDEYHPPAGDSRVAPSPQRMQAMFDWWERIFDYGHVRKQVRQRCDRHLWPLFDEAFEKQPAHPQYLLRHMGADARHWQIDLRYYQDQNTAVYQVSSGDLEDERWVIRAWRADRWVCSLLECFHAKDITKARPDLWASADPSAVVASETATGNANLSSFLCDGYFDAGEPRRYDEVKRLNDGLRIRGRDALLAYLCRMNRVALPWSGSFATAPLDLSELLLLDVQAGVCEMTTRIDEAISAIQTFVRRARLHLEPGWTVTREFARMWDRQFATFEVWQACKRRHLYKENSVEWSELEKARRVEAFRFLESKLKSGALTIAAPGGMEWWPEDHIPAHPCLPLLQDHEPAGLQVLPAQPSSQTREGLNLLGTPERDARPAWLAAAQGVSQGGGDDDVSGRKIPPATTDGQPIPLWLEAAIRVGTTFYRIAAAGVPPAAAGFEPHAKHDGKDCVSCCTESCCATCGKVHPPLVDEYYFWLIDGGYYVPPVANTKFATTEPDDYQNGYQDDYYDPNQQQSSYWQDPAQLPQLLQWDASPLVRLAWCRIHNGEFQQPRKSVFGVPVVSVQDADLVFVGRTSDSLTFSVTNPSDPTPQGFADPSEPGFRYDMAADCSVVLPQVTPASPGGPYLGGLPAYPYFAYDDPGTHLFPLSPYSPAVAIASVLRAHCHFEAALRWYRTAFDPLTSDCTWAECGEQTTDRDQETIIVPPNSGCCDSTDVTCEEARNRSILLHYLDALREWGDALMRRNSPEAFEQARLCYDTARRILGERPANVRMAEAETVQTVGNFTPAMAPLNPRLLDLYDVVQDRLSLIRSCQNAKRLRNGKLELDMPYFGDSPLREGWRTAGEMCEEEWCHRHSPYRFVFLIQKAKEMTSMVRELGSQLLSAFEKGDAEYLTSLRAGHEREIAVIGLDARKNQWRDADWQIEALQKTKAISQTNLKYFANLIQNGLNNSETAYQDLTVTSTVLRGVATVVEAVGEGVGAIPNMFTGIAGFGGTPLFYTQLPVGTPLGAIFAAAARILDDLAEIASSVAGLELTEASWQRRNDEWVHQTQVLAIEIQQIERQILGAQRRRDQALTELNQQARQIEQSSEVENFLRDKFTAHNLYLFLQKETAALYSRVYDLALRASRQAESAFNFERGHTTRHFLEGCAWDTLQEGLMAGERLEAALQRMEHAYLDENVREYELTKHFSLRLHFPLEYLRLRTTGRCEIDLPEWMFDLDYPGMFMRRIKNMTLTIPCVAGPYNGVHCRLTLLSSSTRIDPRLDPPASHCCCDGRLRDSYETCVEDPRIVRQYAAREAIATSSGKNDAGMFELNFRDERYLPFEYLGAVSRWRIELPRENNYFDLDSVSDLIMHLNYTAREGGELLRRAANQIAQRHLPGDGWVFFDVKHDFPDAWELLRSSGRRLLHLKLRRSLFPFVPDHRELQVDRLAVLLEVRQEDEMCGDGCQCPCPIHQRPAAHEIVIRSGRHCQNEGGAETVTCVADQDWPALYHGSSERLIPFENGEHLHTTLEFRCDPGEISRLYLFCHYGQRSGSGECAQRFRRPV